MSLQRQARPELSADLHPTPPPESISWFHCSASQLWFCPTVFWEPHHVTLGPEMAMAGIFDYKRRPSSKVAWKDNLAWDSSHLIPSLLLHVP